MVATKVKPTICVCCGEPMVAGGGLLSRDSNICASCSSLADGMLDEGARAPMAPDESEEQAAEHRAPVESNV